MDQVHLIHLRVACFLRQMQFYVTFAVCRVNMTIFFYLSCGKGKHKTF